MTLIIRNVDVFIQLHWLEYSPMAQETGVQVESYERLEKWFLKSPCLIFGIIRYRPMVSGAIQGKEFHPSLQYISYLKRVLWVALNYS